MTEYRRARQRLRDALNGGVDQMDPSTTRRGLTVIADEVDGVHDDIRRLEDRLDEKIERLESAIDSLRKTMLGVGAGVVMSLVGGAISVFFTR